MASSYRPVAITSVCSKILEHIVYSQTMDHLDNHKILSNLQHGYRKGASTVIDKLAKGIENKHLVDTISLDFSRAFDVVPRERLLLKMRYYGVYLTNYE